MRTDLWYTHPGSLLLSGCIGGWVGSWFADIDQSLPFLTHRSILTHGMLTSLLVFVLALYWKPSITALRALTIGFSAGMASHLCFDLWPRGWYGRALIHVPGIGYLSATISWVWIFASILCCLALAGWLIQHVAEVIAAVLSIGYTVLKHIDDDERWAQPVLTLGIALAIIFFVPGRALLNRLSAMKTSMHPDSSTPSSTPGDSV